MQGKEVFISKNMLENLYISKKLNAYQIAKRVSCGSSTVYRKLEKYGIKRRDNSECHMRYSRKPFSRNKKEMAYLIGFRLGDLHVRKAIDLPGCKTVRVEGHTTKKEQTQLIESLFKRYSHVHTKEILNGNGIPGMTTTRILCFLDSSFSFLLPKNDVIEEWIEQDRGLFLSFLAGYIDAEGHIGLHTTNGSPQVKISSYDKGILNGIHRKLSDLGVRSSYRLHIKKGYSSPSYTTRVYRKDIWTVSIYVPYIELLLRFIIPLLKHKKRHADALKTLSEISQRSYVSRKDKLARVG